MKFINLYRIHKNQCNNNNNLYSHYRIQLFIVYVSITLCIYKIQVDILLILLLRLWSKNTDFI